LFESSHEVAEERLDICQRLLTLDPESVAIYHTEIKDISRRLVIRRRIKEVEQSKVYIDVERLRKEAVEQVRDSYARYKSLRTGKTLPKPTIALVKQEDGKQLVVVTVGRDEMTTLFETMVVQIRDNYISSSDYGLDKYLSIRVRHGTFTTHLRSPAEDSHLVTSKELGSLSYRPNEYWPQRTWPNSATKREWLVDRLAEFSAEYDRAIDNAKSYLTVSRDGKGPGAFEFKVRQGALGGLEMAIVADDTPVEGFVDTVIESCDAMLDRALTTVRTQVMVDLKDAGSVLFDGLAAHLNEADPYDSSILNVVRQTAVTFRVECDRVADWFTRGAGSPTEPFSLDEGIAIALHSVQRIPPPLKANVEISDAETLRFDGRYLSALVDVLFIVLHNVIQHSGLGARPTVRILARLCETGVVIRCENPLGTLIDREGRTSEFDSLRTAIAEGEGARAINREGKTGLHKLSKILLDDVRGDIPPIFGIADDHVFVEFVLPGRLVVKS
jgi:hypothetical protein